MYYLARAITALTVAATALSAQSSAPYLLAKSTDALHTCTVVADSIRSTVTRERLPVAKPGGELTLVRTPTDARLGHEIHASVLVRPDGTADTTTVLVTGTADSAYVRDFRRIMQLIPFITPKVDGCAVWGRYLLELDRYGFYRERE